MAGVVMVAAVRSWVMESQGTYQAGQSADESATPEKVTPLRPWARIEAEMLTLAAHNFSLGGVCCLLYLMRYTIGFHTDTVTLTVDEFCHGKRRKDGGRFDEGTELSRPAVLAGLHELANAGVIVIENRGRGRAIVATYHLMPVDQWQRKSRNIGKKSLPINNGASIGKECSPIAASNGKSSLPKARIIGKKSLPHINIDKKDIPEERNDLLSDASNDAPRLDTPSSSEKPSAPEKPESKARKTFAPDSDAYTLAVHLRDGILSHKPDARVPRADAPLQQWAGVIDLMLRIDERTPERIRALIDAIMTSPRLSFWRGVILSPGNLRKHFDAIEIKWREHAANGRTHQNGRTSETPPTPDDTEDALTRNGVATREWLRRMREQEEAAAKGEPS